MKNKKIINFFAFFLKVYTFKFSNRDIVEKFEQRLKKGNKVIGNNSSNEQILSNYYSYKNYHSKKYYYDKDGTEKYKNFLYFILSLEEDQYLEYSNEACD